MKKKVKFEFIGEGNMPTHTKYYCIYNKINIKYILICVKT